MSGYLNPLWAPPLPAHPWPDATNTGYANAPGYPGSLTPFSSTIQSNTVYSFRSFSGGANVGSSGTPVGGTTFYGCEFDSGSTGAAACVLLYGSGPVTFSYCTFRPTGFTSPPVPQVSNSQGYQYGIEANGGFSTFAAALNVQYCDFWGFANCTDVAGSSQSTPQTFRRNWVHDPRADGGVDHTDGIGMINGSPTLAYLSILGNNIQANGNTNGIAYQGATYQNCTIAGNLLGGFGYTVNLDVGASGTATNVTFTGNTYSTLFQAGFGPLYPTDPIPWGSSGNVWLNNRWLVPPGAAWGHAQYSGYYWLPGTIGNATSNPDELAAGLVSLTDF